MKLTLTAPNIPVLLGGDGKSKESTKGNNMSKAYNPHALTQGDLVILMNMVRDKVVYTAYCQDFEDNTYEEKMYYKRKKNRLSAIQYKLKKLHKEVSRG